ncbi:serine hydrolase [Streptomyces sp. NPDC097619]|uniref:D-alanyl-D-alanine carboxypeptidase family protein n=1 Tax=Streptomyces sp. NPDC097619 TaxID=3157228 RepID=UPI0033256EFC
MPASAAGPTAEESEADAEPAPRASVPDPRSAVRADTPAEPEQGHDPEQGTEPRAAAVTAESGSGSEGDPGSGPEPAREQRTESEQVPVREHAPATLNLKNVTRTTPAGSDPVAPESDRRVPSWARRPDSGTADPGKSVEPSPQPAAESSPSASASVPASAPAAAANEALTEVLPEVREQQPTAAGGKRPGADPGTDSAPDPADDPERTSTFIPLKDLDAPAERTAVLPRVPVRPVGTAAGTAAARPPAPVRTPTPTPRPTPAAAPQAPAGPRTPEQAQAEPLDLLAQLTNTPEPPETPRRTAVRRVKIWTPILLLALGAVAGAQLLRPLPDTRLVAAEQTHAVPGAFSVPWPAGGQGAVRVPGSGTISTFGEQKPVPTASVAKVMTAYVLLKGHPLRKGQDGPGIEVDAKTVADGKSEHESRIEGLTEGSTYSQLDMLKMLMIPSGNNVARLLARWDSGGSEAEFVRKMNAAAAELGMKDTKYTDPSGLDAGTVSTAVDQLKLAEAVMKNEVFRSVVLLPDAEIKNLSQRLINNNSLLSAPELSVRGIKTGSSTPAGGALMWAGYKSVGDETPMILGALMEQRAEGSDPNATRSLALVLENSKKVIEAVRGALGSARVVRKGQTVGYVDDGLGGRTPLVATKNLDAIGTPGQKLRLTLGSKDKAGAVPHEAPAGTEIGVLTAGEGAGAKSVPVAVGTALSEPSFTTRLTRLG